MTYLCEHPGEIPDNLPEITFKFNGKDYRIPRESLYTKISDAIGRDYMTVEVMFLEGWNEWILGLTMLENYYAVYDQENGKVGFAVSKTSAMAADFDTA